MSFANKPDFIFWLDPKNEAKKIKAAFKTSFLFASSLSAAG